MKSESNVYELIVSPAQTCQLCQIPTGAMLNQALPGCLCSDLFIKGFSYKPLHLGVGILAEDDRQYRLLKSLKSARYIADRVKALPRQVLWEQLCSGELQIHSGYIGYTLEVALALKTVRLPSGDFGVELRSGSLFRCFVKSETGTFPQTLKLGECLMQVQQVLPAIPSDQRVLQHDLPLDDDWRVVADTSRFKLSYDIADNCKILCAGSVIGREDFFGNGILL